MRYALAVISLTVTGLPAVQGEEAAATALPLTQADDKPSNDKATVAPTAVGETQRYVVEFAGRPNLDPAYEIRDFESTR